MARRRRHARDERRLGRRVPALRQRLRRLHAGAAHGHGRDPRAAAEPGRRALRVRRRAPHGRARGLSARAAAPLRPRRFLRVRRRDALVRSTPLLAAEAFGGTEVRGELPCRVARLRARRHERRLARSGDAPGQASVLRPLAGAAIVSAPTATSPSWRASRTGGCGRRRRTAGRASPTAASTTRSSRRRRARAGAAALPHGGPALQPAARDARRRAGRPARARRRRGSGSASRWRTSRPRSTAIRSGTSSPRARTAICAAAGSWASTTASRCTRGRSRGTSTTRRASARRGRLVGALGGRRQRGPRLAPRARRPARRRHLGRRLWRAKVGGDLSGRWELRARAVELEGRLTGYVWRPDQHPDTDTGFVVGAQAGARYRLGEGVRLHVLVEDNVGTFYLGQYRGLAILEMNASI